LVSMLLVGTAHESPLFVLKAVLAPLPNPTGSESVSPQQLPHALRRHRKPRHRARHPDRVIDRARDHATGAIDAALARALESERDRKSTRLNSSHQIISYAVFRLKKKKPLRSDFRFDAIESHDSSDVVLRP